MELLVIAALAALWIYADRSNTVPVATVAATASAAGVPVPTIGTPLPIAVSSVPVQQSPTLAGTEPIQIGRLDDGTQIIHMTTQPAFVPVATPLGSSQNQIGVDSGTVPVQSSFGGIYAFGGVPGPDVNIPQEPLVPMVPKPPLPISPVKTVPVYRALQSTRPSIL